MSNHVRRSLPFLSFTIRFRGWFIDFNLSVSNDSHLSAISGSYDEGERVTSTLENPNEETSKETTFF